MDDFHIWSTSAKRRKKYEIKRRHLYTQQLARLTHRTRRTNNKWHLKIYSHDCFALLKTANDTFLFSSNNNTVHCTHIRKQTIHSRRL